MNKLTVIAMSVLTAFVGWCGWLAYHYQGGNDELGSWYRVRQPPPTQPAAIRQEQAMIAAATMQTDLQINGKRIVTTRDMLNPERHDLGHAMARAEHNLTQKTRH